jgi:prefoldin subunit 5
MTMDIRESIQSKKVLQQAITQLQNRCDRLQKAVDAFGVDIMQLAKSIETIDDVDKQKRGDK